MRSRYLGEFRGRDNNFNLMRFSAATMVIWMHAFGLRGQSDLEPIHRIFGFGAGDFGVDIFFVLSGYLVSKSLAGKSLIEFGWARCRRIFPALWTSTLLTVLVIAVAFTTEPAGRFLIRSDTLSYLAHNLTVLPGIGARQDLPSAFGFVDPRVNVPLWTLPHEIEMYLILALVGVTIGLRARYVAMLALFGAFTVVLDKAGFAHLTSIDGGRFLYFFFSGSLLYTIRSKIVLSSVLAAALGALLIACVVLSQSYLVRQAALVLALPYLLIWFAYVPGGALRQWNRLGDYSYGMYVYAFPIQLGLVDLGVTESWWMNFCVTMLIVLPIAIASWHLVENRALRLRLPVSLARATVTA